MSCPQLPTRVKNVLVALAAAFSFSPALAAGIEQIWVADAHMVMEGAPMVVDLDGDGDAEILTAAYEHIIVMDGSGSELWRYDGRGRYSTCPAILERRGDTPLIFAGDNTGEFTCLDGRGNVVWKRDLPSIFCASPAVADLDANGTFEVVQGDKTGKIHAMDALTGALLWTAQLDGECASPAIGDLNSDGKLEICIATGAGKVYAVSATGVVLWSVDLGSPSPDWSTCSPVIFTGSDGNQYVAAGARSGRFVCLNARGELVWERDLRGAIASTISVSDFDSDGISDIFVVTQLGVLYRFDETGRVIWDIDTQGRSLAAGAIVDVDGDSALKYVLCTQNGNLLVFNQTGEITFNHQFPNRTINVTAAFGDIVKTRPGLEFAITGGESGKVYCFGTAAPVNTAAPWRTYRRDNELTGCWSRLGSGAEARMTPANLAWDRILTGEDVVFHISLPGPVGLAKAEATCIRPDGSRQSSIGAVAGQRGVLQMPVVITAPGLYRFEWNVKDGAGRRLAGGSRELTLHPYQNDRAFVRRTLNELHSALGTTPVPRSERGICAALQKEMRDIEREAEVLAALQDAVPGAARELVEEANARTVALNERARRASALARVAHTLPAGTSSPRVVAFEGTTWENRDINRQLPAAVAIPLTISRRAVTGEHEPVSIKLLNVTLDTVRAEVRVETSNAGIRVTPMEAKAVPTNLNTKGWDALPRLGNRAVAVPPLETGEVWLDIDLANTPPGKHTVTALFGRGSAAARAIITLDVLPFEMAGYRDLRLCNWAVYDGDAVPDLLAHGNTVFITGMPHATISPENPGRVSVDFAPLDAFVEPLRGHDVFLLLSGVPNLGVPVSSDTFVVRFGDYIRQVLGRLAQRGIPERNVALYPYDEPGGSGWNTVNRYIEFARQALKAYPGLLFYVNGGGDLPMFQAINEVAGIWCPGYYMLPDSSAEMNFIRASGKTLWSYDCGIGYARPIGWHTKTINVAGQYRMAPVFTVAFGATGLGYWCYNHGPSMWDVVEAEFPLVYVNPDTTHTASRRWEAVREGMEDARIMLALRERLSDEHVNAAAKQKIRHLLEVTAPDFALHSLEEVRLGVARYALDATNNDDTVGAFRQELLDCVAATAE